MPLALYMDVHIPRATELNRPLYTQDDDLLAEARRRQTTGETFSGVIYSHQLRSPIGRCIDDLQLIAETFEPEDLKNRVEFILF